MIAWGLSLGGIVTAGLIQLYPDRFAAAMPMCGVLAGGIATWNAELDAAYAFKTLLAPRSNLQLVHITDPAANLQVALDLFSQGAATPAGMARIALVGALIDLPGWFDPRLPEPAPNDFRRSRGGAGGMGVARRLHLRVSLSRRARAARGRQPVVEHRRRLRPPALDIARP